MSIGSPNLLACHFPISKRRKNFILIEAITYLDIKQKRKFPKKSLENMHNFF
jgi:hypothetical protein